MTPSRFLGHARWWLVLLACTLTASSLRAVEPVIRNLDIRGLRVGGSTTLTVDGDDLGKSPRLLLPFVANQTLKPGGTDKRAVFDVTLADDVTPGYHHLRVVTEGGVSAPAVICTDRLPQQALAAAVKDLPVALHGAVAGAATVETKFQGRAKQRLLIEVEAQRIGSKLKPVVHLYGPKKLQVGWSWGATTLHGDARLEATLPEDGTYTVTLHDVEYAAAAPGFFRLRLGEWEFVDQVFPPVVSSNQAASVELLGMATPVRVDLGPTRGLDAVPLAWPRAGVWSGPRPFVTYSARPELVHQANKDQPQQLPPGAVGVSGRLLTPYAEDRFRVPVSPGTRLRLEVFAERIGSPIDTALVIRNEKGDALVRAEDSPGSLDPVLEYAVPDKVSVVVVGVVDALGRGGPRGIYRLVIDPLTPDASKGGFKLSTTAQRASLPAGGRTVIPILVERQGYLGRIDLTANLPPGVKLEGAAIPEGADGTLVTVQRDEAAFDAVITHWRGRGADGTERTVVLKGHPLQQLQPWLATELALAPSDTKAADLLVDWRGLPEDAGLVPGKKLVLPIKATRANEKSTIKLTLLTSQITPLANNQPDPNKALRQEKAVEMPVKATDGEVVLLVPTELSAPEYAVSIQAELLAADKKVLATAFTPVRQMKIRQQVLVKLDGPNRIEAKLDKKGSVVKIQGKLERLEGMKGDVAVALTGLPAAIKVNPVTVKADATDFTINVALPPTQAVGEIKGLKLSASFAPNAAQPNVRVRSRDVELTLVVQPAQ